MIDFIRGTVHSFEHDHIVVATAGGVGYRLFCANPYDFQGDGEITVYAHLNVREDAMLLFGFPTRAQQAFFRKLLDVSGIGPKLAIGILSGAAPDAIASAIQREDIVWLSKLPGVGKKTAQRMVLDLKDKLTGLGLALDAASASEEGAKPSPTAAQPRGGVWSEAKEALAALGFSEAEADRALSELAGSAGEQGLTTDLIIKKALQSLYRA